MGVKTGALFLILHSQWMLFIDIGGGAFVATLVD
jgi:hypothetical protein